jgi:hypothetical protein
VMMLMDCPFDCFDWVFIGLFIIVVEMGFMVDCRVADLGEFDASPVT